jgi:uncharacterized protein (TIGR00297 family)
VPLTHAILLNVMLVAYAAARKLLLPSGLLAGLIIGTAIAFFLGWGAWAVLVVFFLGGSTATFFQYQRKRDLGVAQGHGGRRSWRHAWANAGVGVLCAGMAWHLQGLGQPAWSEACRWAFVGCFAAALSDTLSSEFGQIAGKMPRLITTGEEVSVGTDGGITLGGSLMGALGAVLLVLMARFMGLVPVRATLPVLLAGIAGNVIDSYLGATLQRQGRLNNDQVNLLNTLCGALLGLAGYWGMTVLPGLLNQWGIGAQSLLDLMV